MDRVAFAPHICQKRRSTCLIHYLTSRRVVLASPRSFLGFHEFFALYCFGFSFLLTHTFSSLPPFTTFPPLVGTNVENWIIYAPVWLRYTSIFVAPFPCALSFSSHLDFFPLVQPPSGNTIYASMSISSTPIKQ